ncbi:MAG: GNAT family N-acetyltransferase [Clostridia bacterium]|nr:GNAT family N-acetyltransferase [Clostridia bacterium]
MDYLIRKREKKDCKGIAHVVTTAWNETYKDILPELFLKELKNNENERAKNAFEKFDKNNNNQFVLEIDNEVVGFVRFGICEDEQFKNCGEIIALYIIKKYKGNGYGRKLIEEAKKELKKLNCNKMIISCLKGNPSNEFYKHIGGKYIKDRTNEILDLKENVYYYEI